MQAAPADHPTEGRAKEKGEFRRAFPVALCALVLLAGIGLTAKALYIPVKAEVAQVLLDRAFDQSLSSGSPVKPWSWADTAPLARISVERLGVSEVVLSGGSGEAMAFGPTALLDNPAGRVTVLAAHRDTHFGFLRDLAVGDVVRLQRIDGREAYYRISSMQTVRWDEFGVPADGGDGLLALATCYPFGTDRPGPLRRVAWARRIDAG